MEGTFNWFLGAFMGLIALIGLIIATHSHGGQEEMIGMGVFIFGVLGIFRTISTAFKNHTPEKKK